MHAVRTKRGSCRTPRAALRTASCTSMPNRWMLRKTCSIACVCTSPPGCAERHLHPAGLDRDRGARREPRPLAGGDARRMLRVAPILAAARRGNNAQFRNHRRVVGPVARGRCEHIAVAVDDADVRGCRVRAPRRRPRAPVRRRPARLRRRACADRRPAAFRARPGRDGSSRVVAAHSLATAARR